MTFYSLFRNGKILALALGFTLAFSTAASAQRIAYVDVNRILESFKEYQDAQSELDRVASKWRQEIAQEYDVIKGLYNRYQAEQVLLSEDARRKREDEIMNREKEVRDLQKARFGPEGELFRRRQEMVRPIQERVYRAIESYATERGYDFIFDKSGAAGIIFFSPAYDKTDDVLSRLK
ncbi:MAG: OmpH family outer membrane protein [Saprospiraceae bacterium]|jgi:outer membrane protein|nr:OmpH family outer membrane protein [Saprospiraceae bacterium]HRD79241.1 OmpH family outer membrane protein [Saprospiraceae bacterium]HRF37291.1 OmpH family outer membrane protein [Saprospiraceae bacterium]HRK81090.1 OmpH family outer membrane protein [Saprospiraceae bacterium]